MNIKELLGENFRDDMSTEELLEAVSALGLIDPKSQPKSVNKDVFDKTASELAAEKRARKDLEKRLMTEEELKAAKDKEVADKIAHYETLTRGVIARERLAEAGIVNPELAELIVGNARFESDEALVKLIDGVVALHKKTKSDTEKSVKADLLAGTPEPPAGKAPDPKADFDKMTLSEQMEWKSSNPEAYSAISGG